MTSLQTFTIIAQKKGTSENENWGIVTARLSTDDKVVDVKSSFWPIPYVFIVPGLEIKTKLHLIIDAKYGNQFQAKGEINVINNRYALNLLNMLAVLNRVEIKKLKVLVTKFGADIFEKIEEVANGSRPAKDLVSSSIKLDDIRIICEKFETSKPSGYLVEAFPPISQHMALKYSSVVTVDLVRDNPYILYWKKPPDLKSQKNPLFVADEISKDCLGHSPSDSKRIIAYIDQSIKILQNNVHDDKTCGSIWFKSDAVKNMILQIQSESSIDDVLWRFDTSMLDAELSTTEYLVKDDNFVARSKDNAIERRIANVLVDLQRASINVTHSRLLMQFQQFVHNKHIIKSPHWRRLVDLYNKCDNRQREVLNLLIEKKVLILSGGAGTGKSLTLALLLYFTKLVLGIEITVGAFTGKAVHRLKQLLNSDDTESLNIDCRTLSSIACSNEEPKSLVIEESSMAYPKILDKIMSHNLEYLLICGDDKQLPSIKPGAFLRDIIASDSIKIQHLKTLYRSGVGSGIATEAPKIFGSNEFPREEFNINGFKMNFDNKLENAVLCVKNIIDAGNDPEKVVMISNTRSNCKKANALLQTICNPKGYNSGKELVRPSGGASWRIGDRVITTENIETCDPDDNKSIKIHNGMQGKVLDIDIFAKKMKIQFENIIEEFESGEKRIEHAYCVTIWKYQGSEIEHTVIFLDSEWGLCCELLYTAVTRGKITSTVFISLNHLNQALKKRIGPMRETRLATRIKHAAKKRIFEETTDE